ncbi:MAG: (2Fe-2S)-binding protein [Neisseriaceae bacterium]|nr:(2Fe-2S)-binding protein [Neisseriaceae bacterium]MBQ9725588.1 (2Fe-2S)-binding protein [Neisseriaceae bacterium]
MYVCLCYGVTADEIRQQSAQGASVQDIQDTLKAGKCCGCCMDEVKSVHCHAQKTHCANKLPQAA